MSKQPETRPTEISVEELKKRKPGWDHVVQPMSGGHVRIISTKRPSDKK